MYPYGFITSLQKRYTGYRHIHLTYAGCRDDRIGSATLFVYIQIQDYVAHKVNEERGEGGREGEGEGEGGRGRE